MATKREFFDWSVPQLPAHMREYAYSRWNNKLTWLGVFGLLSDVADCIKRPSGYKYDGE